MSEITFEQVDEIHSQVFRNFTYMLDKKQYGLEEKWVVPSQAYDGTQDIVGDCEDFALACRKLCRDQGIPSRLVICKVETGEGHCVLEVAGWILDNRCRGVISRDRLEKRGYEWMLISGYEPGDPWQKL